MIIRKLVFGAVLVLALGTTTIAFAKENSNQRQVNKSSANTMYSMMEQYGYKELSQDIQDDDYAAMDDTMNNLSDEDYQKMIDLMRENGYGNMASMMEQYGYKELSQDIRDDDYAAMDDTMNNLSDEDYQKMIDLMRENGYGNMASMMEQIDKDDMISMHNAMGGSAGCFR